MKIWQFVLISALPWLVVMILVICGVSSAQETFYTDDLFFDDIYDSYTITPMLIDEYESPGVFNYPKGYYPPGQEPTRFEVFELYPEREGYEEIVTDQFTGWRE